METVRAAEGVTRSEAEATNSAANRKLYKARVPIYPKEVGGTLPQSQMGVMAFTLSIYYLVPWIRWDRGPRRAASGRAGGYES